MNLVKESLRDFKGYIPKQAPCEIKLDANEGKNILLEEVFGEGILINKDFALNLYPDSNSTQLREELSKYVGMKPSNIVAGSGSNELIELIIKTFADKNEIILSFVPTFHMYAVFSQIYSTKFIGVESNKDFSLDMNKLIEKAEELNPKIIFVSNPNNPTGYLSKKEDLIRLLESTDSIVVIDEAYFEFCSETMVKEINNYENLIILRTLSKAFGLAGIRLGYMVANERLIEILNGVRTPYNISYLSQYIAIQALKNRDKILSYADSVRQERESLENKFSELGFEIFKSYGNFIFAKSDIINLGDKIAEKGIQIREYSGDLDGFYRITIGDKKENKIFIKILEEIVKNEKC